MLTTLLMLAAGAGALFGLMKMKQGVEWGKIVLIVCVILSIILATHKILNPFGSGAGKRILRRMEELEAAFQRTSGERLGVELAKQYPGAKAVVIRPVFFKDVDPEAPSNVDSMESKFNQRFAGLKTGLGDKIEILDVICPRPTVELIGNIEDMKRSYKERTGQDEIPLSEYEIMAWQLESRLTVVEDISKFNDLVKEMPETATMVILLTNFPEQLDRLNLWEKKVTVAGIVDKVNAKVPSAIEQGYISALVIAKPNAEFDSEDAWKDKKKRFDSRLLFVTLDNVKEVVQANEGLFQSGE
ncbi:MAG: hypothetical protein RRC34_16840 [Lentisphaeria bacterium]|nr:hypothetical protein [Lentisphaeria bacterium]